jgi:small subunit ribosomal protein S19
MGRSLKKGPYIDPKLFGKVERMNDSGVKDPITTWARRCTIIPEFVGHTFMVHNGKTHIKVFVTEDMVGHKLGEFSLTRSFRGHGGKAKEASTGGGGGGGGGQSGGGKK